MCLEAENTQCTSDSLKILNVACKVVNEKFPLDAKMELVEWMSRLALIKKNIKKKNTDEQIVFQYFTMFCVSLFSPLEVVSRHYRPQHRILHPKVPPGTSSVVRTSEFYVKNIKH